MAWAMKRFTSSPVPELSTQLFTLLRRALTSYGLATCMLVIFRGNSDEELLGKAGTLLSLDLRHLTAS